MAEQHETPVDVRVHRRTRPFVGGTVAPDVHRELLARAARDGKPVSHVIEAALRVAFGLVPNL